ncbi:MAG: nickel-dependent lactate racemase [Acidobacteria bacterium]|nr:nickel-dependent lactate racemase [Acidobacteriota bacterium]
MAKISLPYGQKAIEFNYDSAQLSLLTTNSITNGSLSKNDILVAMANPIDGQPLEEIIDIGENVVIVVSDTTRSSGSEIVIPLLVARLLQCGLKLVNISILFATGIHRLMSEEEKRKILTDEIYSSIKHFDHNPDNYDELEYLEDTSYSTPVEINRRLLEADHVILTGSIGFHYFAGFTGGRKSVFPGLASSKSIKHNHLLALDFVEGNVKRRIGVGAGRLDKNPVHEDMQEAVNMLSPSFLINTVIDKEEIVGIFCGDWRTAHRRGCAEYAAQHTITIEEKRDLVIASCGGSPKDINLIQSHKALDMAVGALKEGGHIILCAECREGYGYKDFLDWFKLGSSTKIGQKLFSNYEVNGQTAWAMANKIERFHVVLVSDLPENEVRSIGIEPAKDLATAISLIPKNLSGYIIPYACEAIPLVKKVIENSNV